MPLESSCLDFLGREIVPGATLLYAALVNRSAVLKVGQVIATEGQRITVEIDSGKRVVGGGYVAVKRRVVLDSPERCVVVQLAERRSE